MTRPGAPAHRGGETSRHERRQQGTRHPQLARRQRQVPARVGKYRIDHVIGRGAIGIVYKGYDEQIDRPLAIKTLRPEILKDVDDNDEFLKRFAAEARSAGRCLHPNIVTVFDLVEHEHTPYIVMEYVNAGTLENVIRAGTLHPRAPGRRDHGAAAVRARPRPLEGRHPPRREARQHPLSLRGLDQSRGFRRGADGLPLDLTKPSGLGAVGTPNYMAPERFLGRPADVRADLFSAGVILFQLLTGSKPFIAVDLPELMRKLMNELPPRS